jgi:AAA+ ATPase superfamily predicted ATPase
MENPYNFECPLQGKAGFYGRTSELTRIASRIAAERPQSVSVVGPPQTGKSSLVNYLFDPEAQADYLDDPSRYILLRLRLRFETPTTPTAFFERVRQALEFTDIEAMSPDYDGFSEVVRKMMSEGRRMIVILDDFGEVTRNAGFTLDFFSFLRSIANSHDVAYLTTSSRPLNTLCHTNIEESPFFNIFTTVSLEPFSEAEARSLVTDPAVSAGAPFTDEVEPILELAGRQPYLLQATSSLAFEARAAGKRLDVEELAVRAYQISRSYLERVWEELSEAQRLVLASVSDRKTVERRHQYAVESLRRLGLLRMDGEDPEFAAGLMRRHANQGGGAKKGLLRRLFG